MTLGVYLLSLTPFGREMAHPDGRVNLCFGSRGNYTKVEEQVALSSTLSRSYVQNRYPSPLERFVHCGEPLFLFECCGSLVGATNRRLNRPILADRRSGFSAKRSSNLRSPKCEAASPPQTCFSFTKQEGEQLCENQLLHSPSLSQRVVWPPVTLMPNAGSLEPALARPSLLRRAATRLRVRSSAALRASSATTCGSVTNQRATSPKTHESQGALWRPGFFYAQSAPARALNLGT